MTFAKKVILGVGSLLLVIGLSGNVFAQADTQPEQINPDAPEELKVGEPKYKANGDKKDGLKSKEEIEAKITKKAKVTSGQIPDFFKKSGILQPINFDGFMVRKSNYFLRSASPARHKTSRLIL